MTELNHYKYRGARALVLLHEEHLRACLANWQRAKDANINLPVTDDPDYRSMEALLHHILRAARNYLRWICEKLALPDPEINEPPTVERVAIEAADYLDHLLSRWRLPLADIEEERFLSPTYRANWGPEFCIDAMLEHAVMHPIRHSFQLLELMAQQA